MLMIWGPFDKSTKRLFYQKKKILSSWNTYNWKSLLLICMYCITLEWKENFANILFHSTAEFMTLGVTVTVTITNIVGLAIDDGTTSVKSKCVKDLFKHLQTL